MVGMVGISISMRLYSLARHCGLASPITFPWPSLRRKSTIDGLVDMSLPAEFMIGGLQDCEKPGIRCLAPWPLTFGSCQTVAPIM